MTHRERNTAVVVVLLIVVVIYGVFLTGQTARPPASVDTAQASELAPGEGAASTAQALAHYPAMQSEVSHARDALHFADKEMDLAFSYAAWEMKAHPKPVTKEAADDEKRLQRSAHHATRGLAVPEDMDRKKRRRRRHPHRRR